LAAYRAHVLTTLAARIRKDPTLGETVVAASSIDGIKALVGMKERRTSKRANLDQAIRLELKFLPDDQLADLFSARKPEVPAMDFMEMVSQTAAEVQAVSEPMHSPGWGGI
jgi:hypothetical protein